MKEPGTYPVVCFGEVLWDILPAGAVPGGAPMNVAYHLYKAGSNPALITRIGNDKEGKELLDIFKRHGLYTGYFQQDDVQATGKVYAQPNEQNEVVYDIVQPSAWDFIAYEEGLNTLVRNAQYFVYGSLACRNATSHETLFRLLEAAQQKVLDINLRAPHYQQPLLEQLMQQADVLKMNNVELELIAGWYGNELDTEQRMLLLMNRFNIPLLVVTMGADGAILCAGGNFYRQNGIPVTVADTVGSGDAFLAGLLAQLMRGAAYPEALAYANRLGAFIATKKGACPEYRVEEV